MSNNSFLGNWTPLVGIGVLRFDYRIIQRPANGAALPYQVDVYGPGTTKMSWTSANPDTTTSWTRFTIPIEASAWTVSSGAFSEIVANVTSLRIRVRLFTDTTVDTIIGLNNVILRGREENYPTSVTVLSGELFTGNLANLVSSDDIRMTFLPDSQTLRTKVQFDSVSSVFTPTRMGFVAETNATRVGLVRAIQLKNFMTNTYVQVDGRIAPPIDSLFEIEMNTGANYVGPNGELSARIEWIPLNDEDPASDGWINGVDMLKWIPQ